MSWSPSLSTVSGFTAGESEKQNAGGKPKSITPTREKGHLVWSFDVAKGHTPGVTEVLLDAKTGKILSVQKENAAKEAAEAKSQKH